MNSEKIEACCEEIRDLYKKRDPRYRLKKKAISFTKVKEICKKYEVDFEFIRKLLNIK